MQKTAIQAVAALALLAAPTSGLAACTPQAWYRFGEVADYYADSSGNNRRLGAAYSHVPWNNPAYGGNFMGVFDTQCVGGPLGTSTTNSTASLRSGAWGTMTCTMWNAAGYTPPSKDYFIEIWVLPHGQGTVGGDSWIFSAGEGGNALCLRIRSQYYVGTVLGGSDVGTSVPIDTNRWTHLALVNDDGTVTFYVNGVASGSSLAGGATGTPNGSVYFGTPAAGAGFDGLMDEARICTFDPGQFSTTDFLLQPPGPMLIQQPQSEVVWDGGAVPFTATTAQNIDNTYQWLTGAGEEILGEQKATLFLPLVGLTDNGNNYKCWMLKDGLSVTSAVATLSVLPRRTGDVNFYREAVTSTPGLVAFYPVDGDGDVFLTDTVGGNTGLLEGMATFDGRTNRAFGERALALDENGGVQVANSPDFELQGGNGTIEAIVYMSHATSGKPSATTTIFSWAADGGSIGYALQASRDGVSLIYSNDLVCLSWPLPLNLIGRATHVALVISGGTDVTPYINGVSLGTKTQPGFGPATGAPVWIGSVGNGTTLPSKATSRWAGTIDELAIYSTALSLSTIQKHYSRYVYGTNVSAPTVVSQPRSKTLLAGAAPILAVRAAGTLPLTYQWTSNGVPVAEANGPTLAVKSSSDPSVVTYSLWITNGLGWTNTEPIILSFAKPSGSYAKAVVKDGPSSYWRLNETSGTSAYDSAGFNDATYSGGYALGQAGFSYSDPGAVHFDGNGGSEAKAPYSPTLNPATPYSVEFWAKPDRSGQSGRCVIGSQNRAVGRSGYAIYQGLNGDFWEVHMGDSGTVQIWAFGTSPVEAGLWYHVVMVYLPGDPTFPVRIYVNGQDNTDYDNSYTQNNANFLPNNTVDFEIAGRYGGGVPYPGTIDDVAFYNYALNSEQVNDHYLAGHSLQTQILPAQGLVADSKPVGLAINGANSGATWMDSSSDGTRTRQGIMLFGAAAGSQIIADGSAPFNGTEGTICFWMRSSGTAGAGAEGAMLFDRRTSAGLVLVQQDDGSLLVQTAPASANSFASASKIADGRWHHVAVAFKQQSAQAVTIFIDGYEELANLNTSDWAWPSVQQIELGRSHDSHWRVYDGMLDDVRIYNRVLTESEVTAIYSDGSVVDENALRLHFNFDTPPVEGCVVNWSRGTLQWAPGVMGSFESLDAVPPYRIVPKAPMQIFRAVE